MFKRIVTRAYLAGFSAIGYVLTGFGLFIAGTQSASAQTLGGIITNIYNDLQSLPKLLMFLGIVVGIVMVFLGLRKIAGQKASSEDKSHGMIMIVVGVILAGGLVAFIGANSATFFGTDTATSTLSGYGH